MTEEEHCERESARFWRYVTATGYDRQDVKVLLLRERAALRAERDAAYARGVADARTHENHCQLDVDTRTGSKGLDWCEGRLDVCQDIVHDILTLAPDAGRALLAELAAHRARASGLCSAHQAANDPTCRTCYPDTRAEVAALRERLALLEGRK